MPKSPSLTWPLLPISRLPVFMSRCKMPAACTAARLPARPRAILATSSQEGRHPCICCHYWPHNSFMDPVHCQDPVVRKLNGDGNKRIDVSAPLGEHARAQVALRVRCPDHQIVSRLESMTRALPLLVDKVIPPDATCVQHSLPPLASQACNLQGRIHVSDSHLMPALPLPLQRTHLTLSLAWLALMLTHLRLMIVAMHRCGLSTSYIMYAAGHCRSWG